MTGASQRAKYCKLAMVVWCRSPTTVHETAAAQHTADALRHAAVLFDHAAEYNEFSDIQRLISDCRSILGDLSLEPVRIIVNNILSVRTCCTVLDYAQHSNRILDTDNTVLCAHSRRDEERFIKIDDADGRSNTVTESLGGNPVSALALVSFVNRANGIVHEIAISEKRVTVVAITKPSLTVIKKTEGDSADTVCWCFKVDLPYDHYHAYIKMDSPVSAVDYEELMTEIMSHTDERSVETRACDRDESSSEYMGAICTVGPSDVHQMPRFGTGDIRNTFCLRSIKLRSREERICFERVSLSQHGTFVAVFNNMFDVTSNIRWFKDFIGESCCCVVVVRDALAHEISSLLSDAMRDCRASCTLAQMYDSELVGAREKRVAAIIGRETSVTMKNPNAPLDSSLFERPTNVEHIMRNRGFKTNLLFAIDFSDAYSM